MLEAQELRGEGRLCCQAAVQEPKKLSKAQQKKLKKIQEVKEQRAARSQVCAVCVPVLARVEARIGYGLRKSLCRTWTGASQPVAA